MFFYAAAAAAAAQLAGDTMPAPPRADADPGGMLVSNRRPRRGADSRVINSDRTGNLADASRSASLATSGRMSTGPPISKMTRPTVARQAQNSNEPLPLPIRVSFPLTHTGMSGKTRMKTCAPLITFNFLFNATSADCSCLAESRAGSKRRMPYAPSLSVVPFNDPPVCSGTRPLWAFRYFVRRGASCAALRLWTADGQLNDDVKEVLPKDTAGAFRFEGPAEF